jgi:hypothetical protein
MAFPGARKSSKEIRARCRMGAGVFVARVNAKPKYVASNTLTELPWAGTAVLSGDLAAAIGELKAKPGGNCRRTAAAP